MLVMWTCYFAVKTGLGYGQIESAIIEAYLQEENTIDRTKLFQSICDLAEESAYVSESMPAGGSKPTPAPLFTGMTLIKLSCHNITAVDFLLATTHTYDHLFMKEIKEFCNRCGLKVTGKFTL